MRSKHPNTISTGATDSHVSGMFQGAAAGGLFYVAIFIHGALTGLTIILLAVLIGGVR